MSEQQNAAAAVAATNTAQAASAGADVVMASTGPAAAASAAATTASSGKTVKLVSSDGREFTADLEAVRLSGTIRGLIDGAMHGRCGCSRSRCHSSSRSTGGGSHAPMADIGAENNEPIPLSNVTGPILEKVLDYCNHHRGDAEPVDDDDTRRVQNFDGWDKDFCNVDQGTLFELILAANYLDIKSLLDATCKTVADMIRNKTPEEIRATFNIKNDFTPEEEEQVCVCVWMLAQWNKPALRRSGSCSADAR